MSIKLNSEKQCIILNVILFFLMTIINNYYLSIIISGIILLLFFFTILKNKSNIFVLFLFFLLTQKGFQYVYLDTPLYNLMTYLDEIIEGVLLLFLLYKYINSKISMNNDYVKFICFFGTYMFCMVISSLIYRYSSMINSLLDLFLCTKFVIFLIVARKINYKKIADNLLTFAKISAIITFLLSIVDGFIFEIYPKFDFRFFTYSLELCFQHPTYLAAFEIGILSILLLNDKKINKIYYVLVITVTMLTFRTKAIAIIVTFIALYISFIKFNFRFKYLLMAITILIIIYFSMFQIEKYFFSDGYVTIREKLLLDGFDIANNHPLFGAGLATFGTTVAYSTGSIFYYTYGYMSGYYKNQPVADCFWNGIFAESGYLGAIFFIISIMMLFIIAIKNYKNNKLIFATQILILLYCLITSTAETSFFNPAIAPMFIVFGLNSSESKNNEVKKI